MSTGQLPRLAHFPGASGSNPYLRFLDEQLRARGFELVAEPELRLAWLWRHRRRRTFLHFHWELARHYDWRPPSAGLSVDHRKRLVRRPASLLTLARFAGRLTAARLLGYRIVWTIHHVERGRVAGGGRLSAAARRVLASSSRLMMAHDASIAEAVRIEIGRAASRIRLVPHPSYVGVYPAGRDRDAVRAELRIPGDAFTFLCFGRLRADKEIQLLLDGFRLVERQDVVLLVAGEVQDARIGTSVRTAFRSDGRLRPLLGVVPEGRVAELFAAADAAVFARSDPRTSGSLILALSLGVPAVAACLEPYEALLGDGAAGWLFCPGDAAALGAALHAAASDPAVPEKAATARARAEALPTWDEVGAQIAALLLRVA